MKNNYIVYSVDLLKDKLKWYVSMSYTIFKNEFLPLTDNRKREIIKKNLTKKEAYNFCNILNKLKK